MAHVEAKVVLSGWVHSKRDHGGVVFIDLRDHYGLVQLVINNDGSGLGTDKVANLSLESVITVEGVVKKRENDVIRSDIKTGEIEVFLDKIVLQSKSDVLPFQVNEDIDYNEELCLRYRFLDLRRQTNHNNIVLRSRVIKWLRDRMVVEGFMELQTPILTASSPEGSRDFLVPSRLHPGKFYALPQAPQQFKQLLMVSGFDRYFQIAPCFRDEDARAHRSPGEFYQLDVEMSFVEQEDVFRIMEPVLAGVFAEFSSFKVDSNQPFPRITYKDAMLKYGSDKPDLRNPLLNSDVTAIFADADFSIFRDAIARHQAVIRAIPAPNTHSKSRAFFDDMISYAQDNGSKGLAYITFTEDGLAKGPVAKFLTDEKLNSIKSVAGVNNGDSVFFVCAKTNEANRIAGIVRNELGHRLGLVDSNAYKFCWVVDFPFFEMVEDGGKEKIDFAHNPFSMPKGGLEALKTNNIEELLQIEAFQYDIVCNGVELSSGAVRNHSADLLYRAFEIVGYSRDHVDSKFGAMVTAFKYGAPPHAGIAPGIDRIVMMIAGTDKVRDVIAFPLNGKAEDLMMQAPNYVSEKQLREANIKVR